jgi:steroid 5-alpha reductase family enzyme
MIWVCVYLFSITSNIDNITTNLFTIQDDIIINFDGILNYIVGISYNIPQIVLPKQYFYYINTSIVGILLLVMLFQCSMAFGESITSSKYPLYKQYQKSTSQCIPWFAASNKDKSN